MAVLMKTFLVFNYILYTGSEKSRKIWGVESLRPLWFPHDVPFLSRTLRVQKENGTGMYAPVSTRDARRVLASFQDHCNKVKK